MENHSSNSSKNSSHQIPRRLVIKKEVTGDEIFEVLKNYVLNNAMRVGNKNVRKMLSKPGTKFITQIEVMPNKNRLVGIDSIVEIYEQTGGKK